jgi:hypothetical protein
MLSLELQRITQFKEFLYFLTVERKLELISVILVMNLNSNVDHHRGQNQASKSSTFLQVVRLKCLGNL